MEMVRDAILTDLKNNSQELFQKKQDAWNTYAKIRDQVAKAHETMLLAWDERVAAREKMNEAYGHLQQSIENCRTIWGNYSQIRDERNALIEKLRTEQEAERQQMVACFNQASNAYDQGDKAKAPVFAEEGRKHQERRNSLSAQINELIQQIKDAKQQAKDSAQKPDNTPFQEAKAAFEAAKEKHEAAQLEFKRLKVKRDEAKNEFGAIQADYLAAKGAFQQRLNVLKTEAQVERERMLETAGVTTTERKNAKIVKKADGTVQIYLGGIGRADGLGHGHIALDRTGAKFYERGAFEPHGSQNFKDGGGNRCIATI